MVRCTGSQLALDVPLTCAFPPQWDTLSANVKIQVKQLHELHRRRLTAAADIPTGAKRERIVRSVVLTSAQRRELPCKQSRIAALLHCTQSPQLDHCHSVVHKETVEGVELLPSINPTMTTVLSSSYLGNKSILVLITRCCAPCMLYSWEHSRSTAEIDKLYIATV